MKQKSFYAMLFSCFAFVPAAHAKASSGDPAKGFYVFSNICNQCHGMAQVHYGDMLELGISPKEIQSWAARHEIPDGLGDEGNLKKRQASVFDPINWPYPTEQAARKANYGDAPPDLSHLSSFLSNGETYVRNLLLDYQEPPKNIKLEPGLFYNPTAFTRHRHFRMSPPFAQTYAQNLTYPDGKHPTDQQMAEDVAAFLEWIDDPHKQARQISGILICLYLGVIGILAFLWRAHVWKK